MWSVGFNPKGCFFSKWGSYNFLLWDSYLLVVVALPLGSRSEVTIC